MAAPIGAGFGRSVFPVGQLPANYDPSTPGTAIALCRARCEPQMTSVRTATFALEAPDGTSLFAYRWLPDKSARAVIVASGHSMGSFHKPFEVGPVVARARRRRSVISGVR